MSAFRLLSTIALSCAATLGPAVAANAADGLVAEIRERGELRCGVSKDIPGFATQDASGTWRGLEVDYCRALAAAVIGQSAAVEFVPLAASSRFPALKLDRIDVLLASTSWTLSREALLGVRFAAVLFHDGQSFMVPAASTVRKPLDLMAQEICVEKDTTHADRLHASAKQLGYTLQLREAVSAAAAADDFFAGRCAALSAESAQLAALRLRNGADARAYRTLPDQLSREVLSVVVRNDDAVWETAARWVAYALVMAEEQGVDASKAASAIATGTMTDVAKTWGFGAPDIEEYALIAQTLGMEKGWLNRAVAAAGNYGEIFDRNLGNGSPLGLDRGPNRLTARGGLMFTPPVR